MCHVFDEVAHLKQITPLALVVEVMVDPGLVWCKPLELGGDAVRIEVRLIRGGVNEAITATATTATAAATTTGTAAATTTTVSTTASTTAAAVATTSTTNTRTNASTTAFGTVHSIPSPNNRQRMPVRRVRPSREDSVRVADVIRAQQPRETTRNLHRERHGACGTPMQRAIWHTVPFCFRGEGGGGREGGGGG